MMALKRESSVEHLEQMNEIRCLSGQVKVEQLPELFARPALLNHLPALLHDINLYKEANALVRIVIKNDYNGNERAERTQLWKTWFRVHDCEYA
jgi:hypothetical protein